MSVSIALCTYNAAAYLAEQLESIAAQSCPPDELVVCDDRSSDATPAILQRFAASAPFRVRLEVNDCNLGSAANFAKAVALCRGDLIALADQDDFWMPHKLERLSAALAAAPRAGFAMSDAVVVDRNRRPLGYRLWQAIRFSRADQWRMNHGQAATVLLHRNVVTGATMIFRAALREMLLPVPDGWVHDGWFALLLSAVADCVAIAEPLIEYRQHPTQQIGAMRENLYQQYLRSRKQPSDRYEAIAANYAAAGARLAQFRDRLPDSDLLVAIDWKVSHYQARARMRAQHAWRLPIILRELSRRHYTRFSMGWKSLAQDLFL